MRRRGAALGLMMMSGCAHPGWNYDESNRIDEVMAVDPLHGEAAAANGIVMTSAPPLAAGWRKNEGYEIQNRRTKRTPALKRMSLKGNSPPRRTSTDVASAPRRH